jgi:hypothetical protein
MFYSLQIIRKLASLKFCAKVIIKNKLQAFFMALLLSYNCFKILDTNTTSKERNNRIGTSIEILSILANGASLKMRALKTRMNKNNLKSSVNR